MRLFVQASWIVQDGLARSIASNALRMRARKLCAGRPFGLPDWPFLKLVELLPTLRLP
jgi:hypothetical protein